MLRGRALAKILSNPCFKIAVCASKSQSRSLFNAKADTVVTISANIVEWNLLEPRVTLRLKCIHRRFFKELLQGRHCGR